MSFIAAAVVGGVAQGALGYLGASKQASAATQAAQLQAQTEQQALNLQKQQLTQLQPYENVGAGAAGTLGTLTGANGQAPNFSAFTSSPDYAFAQQQGNAALQNYLNANGTALSGAGLTSAINYNQGLATQQYGNYFNRLMQIATLGSNAAGTGVSGTNAAANTLGNIGASTASGVIGSANANAAGLTSIGAGVGGGINNALLYNALNRGNPSGYGTPASPYPNFADLGIGGGVGTGGYNYVDAQAGR